MQREKRLFDAYRLHPRNDGLHYELSGRLIIEKDELKILCDQYGNLRAVLREGPVSSETQRRMERYSNGYYHLMEVERFVQPEKLQAYRHTTYVAEAPGQGVRIRIGEVDPGLGESWAVVTASNPGSFKPLPDDLNAQRARELEGEVLRSWTFYRGKGMPDEPGWSPEQSLLVLGIGRDEAIALGRRYGQNAIVVGAADARAELVECFPEG
jgi:hypothetical protein